MFSLANPRVFESPSKLSLGSFFFPFSNSHEKTLDVSPCVASKSGKFSSPREVRFAHALYLSLTTTFVLELLSEPVVGLSSIDVLAGDKLFQNGGVQNAKFSS
jgi:hypothetical protein